MRVRCFVWLACGVVGASGVGCSSRQKDDGPADPVAAFEQATNTEWILDFHPEYRTVRFAMPAEGTVALPPGDPKESVLALLDRYASVFGMVDPETECAGALLRGTFRDRRRNAPAGAVGGGVRSGRA